MPQSRRGCEICTNYVLPWTTRAGLESAMDEWILLSPVESPGGVI